MDVQILKFGHHTVAIDNRWESYTWSMRLDQPICEPSVIMIIATRKRCTKFMCLPLQGLVGGLCWCAQIMCLSVNGAWTFCHVTESMSLLVCQPTSSIQRFGLVLDYLNMFVSCWWRQKYGVLSQHCVVSFERRRIRWQCRDLVTSKAALV